MFLKISVGKNNLVEKTNIKLLLLFFPPKYNTRKHRKCFNVLSRQGDFHIHKRKTDLKLQDYGRKT
jgi:hypothetical protein